MDHKGFAIPWFLLIFSTMNGLGSGLKCCYNILPNGSTSYHVSEEPKANCTSMWDEGGMSLVDEKGGMFPKRVDSFEPNKLILKENKDNGFKLVKCTMNCPTNGAQQIHEAECTGRCFDLGGITDAPGSYNGTTEKGQNSNLISVWIIIPISILSIITIIWYRKKICQVCQLSNVGYRCTWRAVPNNETPPVKVNLDT